jgi:hypothetical protein
VAHYTVAQFKARVAALPAQADSWQVEVPDDLMIPVHDSRTIGPNGELMIHIRGYMNLATGEWTTSV